MDENEPNVKAMFAGVQMTLLAIVCLLASQLVGALAGVGLLLAAAGTVVVGIAIKR